ncbi:hypothetical protein Tco_1270135 [Tanacetum coccineum]
MAPGRHPTVNRNPPVNRSTNRNNVDINSGIDTQMLNQLIATRVVEALAAADVTHAATRNFVQSCMKTSVVLKMVHYLGGLPLSIKGNVTSSKPVDFHEAIDMAQGLMYQVVQELGENSGDKRKWNGNHYNHNPNNTNNTSNLNPKKCPETARVFTAGCNTPIFTYSSES